MLAKAYPKRAPITPDSLVSELALVLESSRGLSKSASRQLALRNLAVYVRFCALRFENRDELGSVLFESAFRQAQVSNV